MKICISCGKEIRDDATKCKFCGETFQEDKQVDTEREVTSKQEEKEKSKNGKSSISKLIGKSILFLLLSIIVLGIFNSLQKENAFPYMVLIAAFIGLIGVIISIRQLRKNPPRAKNLLAFSLLLLIFGIMTFFGSLDQYKQKQVQISEVKVATAQKDQVKPIETETKIEQEEPDVTTESFDEEKYIQIIAVSTKIYFKNNAQSDFVATAKKGDIFEFISIKSNWYEINMFSGEYRYVKKDDGEFVSYTPKAPKSASTRQAIFNEIARVEEKAYEEAYRKYPNDIYKNIDYMRILDDRYKLDIFHRYGVQSPIHSKLLTEGVLKELK